MYTAWSSLAWLCQFQYAMLSPVLALSALTTPGSNVRMGKGSPQDLTATVICLSLFFLMPFPAPDRDRIARYGYLQIVLFATGTPASTITSPSCSIISTPAYAHHVHSSPYKTATPSQAGRNSQTNGPSHRRWWGCVEDGPPRSCFQISSFLLTCRLSLAKVSACQDTQQQT